MATKPHLDWIIVCDDVRAEVGDKISLMGLFDTIYSQVFPAVHPRLAIVASWSGVPGDYQSTIEIVSPTGELVQPAAVGPMKIPGHGKVARHVVVSLNVPFKSEGDHQIKISLDEVPCGSAVLKVQKVPKPQ